MYNTDISIILISSSDIISVGLSRIIGENFSCNLISTDDINNLLNIEGNILLIVPEEYYKKNSSLIYMVFSEKSHIKHILFSHEKNVGDNQSIICLSDKVQLICLKIKNVIDSFWHNDDTIIEDLSRREKEVLQLVAKGLSNKEIADKLSVSTHTVISHRKNISEKIGIRSASGMAMYAVLKKIIDINDIDPSELM